MVGADAFGFYMSLQTMSRRLSLEIPGLVDTYAVTLLTEALSLIYDSRMWSFQLKESGWLTPGLQFPSVGFSGGYGQGGYGGGPYGGGSFYSQGTVTVNSYSNLVTGDANASSAWFTYLQGGNLPLFTSFQFRSPYYSLYNIVSVNTEIPTAIVLTLDRPWMEPGGTQQNYMIYQAYFPVPVSDFKRFLTIRDTTNNAPIDFWSKTQMDLAVQDPERTIFDDPAFVVPYEVDMRPNSATFGNMLYELWPHPLSVLPYTYAFLRTGPQLVNLSDTVPYPLTEEVLLWRAKECACLFKEAQKGEQQQRGSGADWRFLSQAASAEYERRIKPILRKDDDLVNLYVSNFRRDLYDTQEPFATITGGLQVGRF